MSASLFLVRQDASLVAHLEGLVQEKSTVDCARGRWVVQGRVALWRGFLACYPSLCDEAESRLLTSVLSFLLSRAFLVFCGSSQLTL